MQYMLLIYGEPGRWESAPEEERNEVRGRYVALAAELREREAYVDGNELQDVAAATTVRVIAGETEITDGPFAETKEALGGYLIFEADDIETALELAARIPSTPMGGAVEVRPIVEW